MKTTKWIAVMLVAGVLTLAGCSKPPKVADEVEVNGVKVAMPALQKSLSPSTDKDVQNSLGKVGVAFRYRDYGIVQAGLTQLAANPALTAEQKKLVAQVDEQVKQVVAKGTAPTQ